MKYDYLVKYNGVYYPAGQDVPNGEVSEVESSETKTIKTVAHEITEEDINSMNYMALKKLARDNGIELADKIKQAELRKILIKHFGL